MIDILVWLAIIVIVCLVLWFLLSKLALPEPAGTIVQIAIVILVAVVVIGFLLNVGGHANMLRLH